RRRRVAARAEPLDAGGALPGRHLETGDERMRPIAAEVLKLARRRGLMIWSALLTVGSVVLFYVILVALHAANASKHGHAGRRLPRRSRHRQAAIGPLQRALPRGAGRLPADAGHGLRAGGARLLRV